MTVVLLALAAVLVWQALALASIAWIRPDLAGETRDALINVWLWPVGVVVNLVIAPIIKARRERARQARITAKVEAGEYDADWARRQLHWKG